MKVAAPSIAAGLSGSYHLLVAAMSSEWVRLGGRLTWRQQVVRSARPAAQGQKWFVEFQGVVRMAEQEEQVKKNMLRGYRRGVWGGRFVTVKKPYWELIQEWAKKSGMSQASFYRAALMRGALEMAKGFGFADKYPDIQE